MQAKLVALALAAVAFASPSYAQSAVYEVFLTDQILRDTTGIRERAWNDGDLGGVQR